MSMVKYGKNKISGEMSLLTLVLFLLALQLINSYTPTENLGVNCGDSGNDTFKNRNWVGDVGTTLLCITSQSSSVEAKSPNSPSVDQFPYGSARLSHSQFTYSFPVSNGPKFLRLHFYPTSYPNFQPQNSLFSVKAANFTLLQDFNASLWVWPPNDHQTLIREFIINVQNGTTTLNVTFLPTTGAYAFVNGIELVSMPPFLYYTLPDDPNPESGPQLVLAGNNDARYPIQNDTALATFYRVNVGDNQVPPSKDTGMFRNWENDSPYLEKQYPRSVSSDFTHPLNYKNNTISDYFAPQKVYTTARNYGMYATTDYNVTWEFVVDSQFYYMVRLHFCEFDWHISRYGDRAFQIFIDDKLVEPYADVMGWSGNDRLVPVHRDYVLFMQTQLGLTSKKTNLSIKLQRLPQGQTTHRDVLLNGIEIFKISDRNNLAGPNPQPILALPNQKPSKNSKSNSNTRTLIVAVVVAVSSCLVLASVLTVFLFLRRRKRGDVDQHYSWKTKPDGSSSLPSQLCRYFTIAEIVAATNNFDDVFIIGVGGFGHVYKGYIDGTTPVAIKRLKAGSQQGVNEFLNEIEMLSKLRHLHLVPLIGYCNDGAEMILVYDFMQRGTLREYLYDSDNPPLSWKQRLEILLGAARGLHYLHEGASHNIIHRDVKSTNILLDEKWVAKVSDFGLSKVGPTGTSMTHVSTIVKGSLGYLDPEYCKRQRLTLKSDVYSFGVVLLEVLCGRPALIRTVDMDKQKASLVDWVRRCYDGGEIDQTVDPFLKDSITAECLKCYSRMALSCLVDDGNQRPSMKDVVGALEFTLQLVESEEEEGGTKEEGIMDAEKALLLLLPQFMSEEEGSSEVRFTSSSDGSGSKTSKATSLPFSTEEPSISVGVFSEIVNPRAR